MGYNYEKLKRFNGPRSYNVRHFVDGRFNCLEGKSPYWDTPIFYENGYQIGEYYEPLNQTIEIMTTLFTKVNTTISEIGNKKIMSLDSKTIKEQYKSYQAIEEFFSKNNGSGVQVVGGVEVYIPNGELTDDCLKTISFDDEVLISNYNNEQRQRDDKLFERLKGDYDRKWDEYLQDGEIVKHHKIETAWDGIRTSVYDILNSR